MKRLLGLIVGLIFALPSMAATLPAGYTELEYIQSDGRSYIDTGVVMNDTTGIKIVIDDTSKNSPNANTAAYYIGTMLTGSYMGYFTRNNSAGFTAVWAWNGEGILGNDIQSTHSTVYINYKNDRRYVYNNGIRDYVGVSSLPTLKSGGRSLTLFSIAGNLSYNSAGKIYSVELTEGSEVVHKFVPARNSSGVIGMYDIMDNNPATAFHTNKGSSSFTGGDPVNPCKNLLHMTADNITIGKYIDGEGLDADGDANFAYNKNITVNPNTDYTMSVSGPIYLIIGAFYDENNNMLSRIVPSDRNISLLTMRSPNNAKYFRFSANFNSGNSFTKAQVLALNWQLEAGSTATSYTPFNASCFCQENQAAYTYESATGTVTRNGTPTPTNPIEPIFYTQGDMVLRKIANYADSYDASTGKITRRVGVKIFDGTEALIMYAGNYIKSDAADVVVVLSNVSQNNQSVSNAFVYNGASIWNLEGYPNKWVFNPMNDKMQLHVNIANDVLGITDYTQETQDSVIAKAKAFFKRMYDAGTPVTMYYPLKTEVEETWSELYCSSPIKIATTKYNNTAFSSVVTALSNAVDTIKTVVANTINQATAVANLHSGKQTKPTDACPNGKICLLVEDEAGTPHWYEIIERAPGIVPAGSGYTQVEYLQSSGTQYINTGIVINSQNYVMKATLATDNDTDSVLFGAAYASDNQQGVTINTAGSFRYGNGAIQALSSPMTSGVVHSLELSWKQLSVDGVVRTSAGSTNWPSSVPNYPLYVFGRNGMGTAGFFKAMKLYAFQIYDDGVMVRDLVPARRNSDGVLGMYDTVSGNFFTNAGSGEFTAPGFPENYTQLSYLESSGEQYIDLGYPISSDMGFDIKVRALGPAFIFGDRKDNSNQVSSLNFDTTDGAIGVRIGTGMMMTNTVNPTQWEIGTDYTISIRNGSVVINGETKSTVPYGNSYYSGNAYLFAVNNNGTLSQSMYNVSRIYYFKVYKNGTLYQDFVPARSPSGVLGMYDVANGVFYTNAGTGTFTAGAPVQ